MLSRGCARRMLRTMCLIRHFEERVVKLFHQGLIRGATHVYLGEEAVAAGACAALRPGDTITSTHRGHGHCIARGLDVKPMLAELLGKATGYCGGKGGSMHIADLKRGILGANGIVGGGIPLAAGAGLTAAYKQTGQVTLCFFGDGAAQQGGFHESLNLAAVWKLPVVYICENNCFALTTPNRDECCIENIGDRAAAYGIPGCVIDGNDAFSVYEAVRKAVSRARRGGGPSLIECKTYRIRGHFEGDDSLYRTKEEVAEARKRDPIDYWKGKLLGDGVITEEVFTAINEEADAEVADAALFAEQSPCPATEEALILTAQA